MLSGLDSPLPLDGVCLCDPCGNETGRHCLHITTSRSLALSFSVFSPMAPLSIMGVTFSTGTCSKQWKSPYPTDNRGWPDSSLLLPAQWIAVCFLYSFLEWCCGHEWYADLKLWCCYFSKWSYLPCSPIKCKIFQQTFPVNGGTKTISGD